MVAVVDRHRKRRERVQAAVRRLKLDALLISDTSNVRYVSGFTGDSSWLLVGAAGVPVLITDGRFVDQARAECAGCRIYERKLSLVDTCRELVSISRWRRVGVESDAVSYGAWKGLQGGDATWEGTAGVVEGLRAVKDREEVDAIRAAIAVAERAFLMVRGIVRPGMREIDVSNELECVMRHLGAAGESFGTIVLFGERSLLPHGQPGQRVLQPGELVLIDWGARLGLYNSDLTRMLLPGTIGRKLERVYRVVLEAQQAAIGAARPGMLCEELDEVARRLIRKAGLGKFFRHGVGHGVGMDIHECPRVTAGSKTALRQGMVITVEPGVYVPGWGGIRIEDMVLITRSGGEVLTSLAKGMEEARMQ